MNEYVPAVNVIVVERVANGGTVTSVARPS
jgi:hypothetical protein